MVTLRYREGEKDWEPTLAEVAQRAKENPEYLHCELCDERIGWAETGFVQYGSVQAHCEAMLEWFKPHQEHLGSLKIKKGRPPEE